MGHGHHHGGGGFSRGGGGAYFAPPSYGYPYPYYDEPNYVPVFIVEDEEDRQAKREKAKAKAASSGLGIFAPARPNARVARRRPHMHGLGAVTFGDKTYNPTVYAAQAFLNPLLKSRGYLTIDQDGKLGKGTCGAVAWLMQGGATDLDKGVEFDLMSAPQAIFEVWNVCASSDQTPPTPVSAVAKSSGYEKAVTAIAVSTVNPDAVRETQNALNAALVAAGMCPIGVDGSVGADTCGAQTWLIANAGGDGLTQTQRDAISKRCSASARTVPSACPTGPVTPASITTGPVVPEIPVPTKKPISTAGMVMGVGLAAAAVTGLYLYFKHKAV